MKIRRTLLLPIFWYSAFLDYVYTNHDSHILHYSMLFLTFFQTERKFFELRAPRREALSAEGWTAELQPADTRPFTPDHRYVEQVYGAVIESC